MFFSLKKIHPLESNMLPLVG